VPNSSLPAFRAVACSQSYADADADPYADTHTESDAHSDTVYHPNYRR
jgi:hypothetical protein